jgi:hypothetical protein
MVAALRSPGFAAGDGSRGAAPAGDAPAGDAPAILARRTPRTGARRGTTLNLRSLELRRNCL